MTNGLVPRIGLPSMATETSPGITVRLTVPSDGFRNTSSASTINPMIATTASTAASIGRRCGAPERPGHSTSAVG